MLIECTKKLSEAMKIELAPYDKAKAEPFYEWHANLFYLFRRKGVLLMNNKTRYCIVLYGLKMEHFRKFDEIVLDAIRWTFLNITYNSINLVSLNHWIGHRLMCGSLNYAHPIDLLRNEFGDVYGCLNYL